MQILKNWNHRFKIVFHPDVRHLHKDLVKDTLEFFHDIECDYSYGHDATSLNNFNIYIAPDEMEAKLLNETQALVLVLSDEYKTINTSLYQIETNSSALIQIINQYIEKMVEVLLLKSYERSMSFLLTQQDFLLSPSSLHMETAQELENWLLDIYHPDEIVEKAKEYFNKKNMEFNVTFNAWEDEGYQYFPLTDFSLQTVYFAFPKDTDLYLVRELYLKILDWSKNNEIIWKQKKIIDDKMEILQALDIPFVLLDKQGRHLLHNAYFTALAISIPETYQLKNSSYVSRENKNYRVNKVNLIDDAILIYFDLQDEHIPPGQTISSSELGVITSSLAHEINNPLGGILAGLSLLELDEWDEGALEIIKQMKISSLRSKKLVETFLGFSRMVPVIDSISSDAIHHSFIQALDLMRYRLVENNLNFKHQFIKKRDLGIKVNEAMFTMGIYLVLGEILTTFNHQKLIDNSLPGLIEIKCLENGPDVVIDCNVPLPLETALINSKLLGHILDLHQMTLECSSQSVIFKGDSLET